MAFPGGYEGESVPSVDDCSRTAPPPYSGRLACLGITGWLPSESPAGLPRNRRLLCVGIRSQVVGQGNIDVRAVRGGGSGDTSAKLAFYLSKYITKTLGDQTELAHRYRRSHNIRIDERIEEYEDDDLTHVAEEVFRHFPEGGPSCYIQTESGGGSFISACLLGRRC
jgi:hypothetical protein